MTDIFDIEQQTERDWWESLTTAEKREIENLQIEIFDSGTKKHADFVMLECRNEAIRRFKDKK